MNPEESIRSTAIRVLTAVRSVLKDVPNVRQFVDRGRRTINESAENWDRLPKLIDGRRPITADNCCQVIEGAFYNSLFQKDSGQALLKDLATQIAAIQDARLPQKERPQADSPAETWVKWFKDLGKRCQDEKRAQPTPPPTIAPALAEYLRHLERECNVVWCPGLPTDEASRIELLAVYAELHTREPEEVDPEKDATHGQVPSRSERRVSAIRSVVEHERLAILGEPGGGKSTFLRYLAVSLARHQLSDPESGQRLTLQGWPEAWLDSVPIWVELRKLPKPPSELPTDQRADWLWAAIVERTRLAGGTLPQEAEKVLADAVKHGRAVFLLDGLDEITDHARKEFLQDAIWDLANKRFLLVNAPPTDRSNRFVVTCRKRTWDSQWAIPQWTPENGAEVRDIDWFDLDDRRKFLNQWFREQARMLRARGAKGQAQQANQQVAARLAALPEALMAELEDPKRNRNQRLESLVALPLNLTMIAWLRSRPETMDRPLANSRAAIFEQTIHAILWELDEHKGLQSADDLTLPQLVGPADRRRAFERILAEIAFISLKGDPLQPLPGLARSVVLKALRGFCGRGFRKDPDIWATEVLKTIQCRAGLLKESAQNDGYEFAHRTFQEFLAGVHMATHEDFHQVATDWLGTGTPKVQNSSQEALKTNRERLWEPLRLACGYLTTPKEIIEGRFLVGDRRNPAAARELIRLLTQEGEGADWRNVWLAGELWLELEEPDVPSRLHKNLLEQVRQRLTALVEAGALSAPERAAAGSCLGYVGDPRPGVGLFPAGHPAAGLPKIDWITIPAGPFFMGDNGDFPDLDQSSMGFFWLAEKIQAVDPPNTWPAGVYRNLDRPYRMSRYPVTVQQYAAFVEDGGYRDDTTEEDARRLLQWWTEAGMAWKREQSITAPADSSSVFQTPNHPRVGVNWYEAIAFCRWLTQKLREVPEVEGGIGSEACVTLPSEPEWERVARGWDPKRPRVCPWGPIFTQEDMNERCNWGGSEVGHTSAVGVFQQGHAENGAADLAGNVWEWTRSVYRPYPYRPDRWIEDLDTPATEKRVLRGGAWAFDSGFLFGAYRGRNVPNYRNDSVGFRCVVVAAGGAGR